MKRPLLILAATALSCAGLSAVATAHTVKFDSTVTIDYDKNGNDPDDFDGAVSSDRGRCVRNRTIEVFRETAGDDALIGTTTTDAEGNWELVLAGDADVGDYYAVAKRKKLRRNANHRHICRPAVSETESVNGPPAP